MRTLKGFAGLLFFFAFCFAQTQTQTIAVHPWERVGPSTSSAVQNAQEELNATVETSSVRTPMCAPADDVVNPPKDKNGKVIGILTGKHTMRLALTNRVPNRVPLREVFIGGKLLAKNLCYSSTKHDFLEHSLFFEGFSAGSNNCYRCVWQSSLFAPLPPTMNQ